MLSILLSSCELFRTTTRSAPATRQTAGRAVHRPAAGNAGHVARSAGGTASSNMASRPYIPMTKKAEYNPKAVRYNNYVVNDLINTAKSYGGTNYRTGGGTSVGLDCSGLVQVSFKQIGLKLPRTASEQAVVGQTIHVNDLRPGDLVFFNTDFKGKSISKINHTGIVTHVNGDQEVMFIHASSSRGVIEDNLYADYWQRGFIKATRLLD
ncbi:C40 family peptidase [Siphonobacter sp. SORGH_AS_0500]|uniref:C40 family peptidase n=1 Tax=Siphonobacter sp. SORGH_AS_0500 TaxID=1864824 RepID=UPI00285F645A|nr:C40 family peptidase [Siphonobacter sp. SORGH_AS_0500]MDR6195509.1 putative lipoprotein NlpC [Siphonobacter sp. SORGH_AS_0500]